MNKNLQVGLVLALVTVMCLCFATSAMAKPPEEMLGTWTGKTLIAGRKNTLILTFGKKEIAATYVTISGGKATTTRKIYKYKVEGKKMTLRWGNNVQTRIFEIKGDVLIIPKGIDKTSELDMDRVKT